MWHADTTAAVVKPQSDILSVTLACLQKVDCQSDGQLMLADKIQKRQQKTNKKHKKTKKLNVKTSQGLRNCLWAKKGLMESQPFIEGKALLKERLY